MTKYTYHQLPALGTLCELWYLSESPNKELELYFDNEILQFENRFSRFQQSSLVSKFNLNPIGERIVLDQELESLINKTLYWMHKTNGIFNPFVLPILYQIGYANSFTPNNRQQFKLNIDTLDFPNTLNELNNYLVIDKHTITKLKPIYLDLGGIGKGYLTDKLIPIIENYSNDFTLSMGGDMYIYADSPWEIDIIDENGTTLNTININNQAVATSSISKRTFGTNNHIINPKDRISISPAYKQVTVVANTAENADILAKTILINPEFKTDLIIRKYFF